MANELTVDLTKQDLEIRVRTPDGESILVIKDQMRINEKNMIKEFSEQASWFAYYGALLESQQDKLAIAKRQRDRYKSQLATEIRQGKIKLVESSEKAAKVTEAAVLDYVENDKKFVVYQDEVDLYEGNCQRLKVLVRASEQRKEMLIQIGAVVRQEQRNLETMR